MAKTYNAFSLSVYDENGNRMAVPAIKGDKGDKGDPYTLTDTDRNSIAAAVKASLSTITITGTDEDGASHSWTVYGL